MKSSSHGVIRQLRTVLAGVTEEKTTYQVAGGCPVLTNIQGASEVFVTGDKAVQAVGRVGGMKILSPRQFGEKLVDQPEDGRGR